MKSILLIIFFFGCGHINRAGKSPETMDKFKPIDNKLDSFAKDLNAKIGKEGQGFFINGVMHPDKTGHRRIVWMDGPMGKAVIIKPYLDINDTSLSKWDFLNLAWLEQDSSGSKEKPFWQHYLLRKVEFSEIERNIDQLLNTSKENLQNVKREDLKAH